MRLRTTALAWGLLAATTLSSQGELNPLEVSWETVLQKSTSEGKCLFVAFLGDGWSIASSRFSRDVLETQAFKDFAGEELVYCPILARTQPRMSPEKTARLQSLVIHFDMKAYPTFIILAPDGTEILRHGYRKTSANEYISLLREILPELPKAELED